MASIMRHLRWAFKRKHVPVRAFKLGSDRNNEVTVGGEFAFLREIAKGYAPAVDQVPLM